MVNETTTTPAQAPSSQQGNVQTQQGPQQAHPLLVLVNEVLMRIDNAVSDLPLSRLAHQRLQQAFQDTANGIKPRLDAMIQDMNQQQAAFAALQKSLEEARIRIAELDSLELAHKATQPRAGQPRLVPDAAGK